MRAPTGPSFVSDATRRMLSAVAVFGIALCAGFVVRAAGSSLLGAVVRDFDPTTALGEVPGVLGSMTIGIVGGGYLLWSESSKVSDAFNVRSPSPREAGIAVGGVVLHYLVLFWLVVGFTLLDVPIASGIDESNTRGALLLGAIASILVVAPSEELVSRRLVQDALVAEVGRHPGVVAASLVFALPHAIVRYTGPGALAGVAVAFAGGLVYGYLYDHTDNLAVPILVHGTFNALNYLLNYTVGQNV